MDHDYFQDLRASRALKHQKYGITLPVTNLYRSWFIGIMLLIESGIRITQKHINLRVPITAPDMTHFIFEALPRIVATGFKLVKLDFEFVPSYHKIWKNPERHYSDDNPIYREIYEEPVKIDNDALKILSDAFINPIFNNLVVIDCRNFNSSQLEIFFSNLTPPSVRRIFTRICPPEIFELLYSQGIDVSVTKMIFEYLHYYHGKKYPVTPLFIDSKSCPINILASFRALIAKPEIYVPPITISADNNTTTVDIFEYINQYLAMNPYLDKIKFFQTRTLIIDGLSKSMFGNTNLKLLILDVYLTEKEIMSIATMLCFNKGLEKLVTRYDQYFKDYRPIAKSLMVNNTLKSLHINFSGDTRIIMTYFAKTLWTNYSLQTLYGHVDSVSFSNNCHIHEFLTRNQYNARMRSLTLLSVLAPLVL